MEKKLAEAKTKSSTSFNQFINWSSNVINKTTGYDQITEMEKAVSESERTFEKTTQELRDLNTIYMVLSRFASLMCRTNSRKCCNCN